MLLFHLLRVCNAYAKKNVSVEADRQGLQFWQTVTASKTLCVGGMGDTINMPVKEVNMPELVESSSTTDDDLTGKERLIWALAEVLRVKPFHKISIQDVCDKAQVSRQTFYRHFENKHAAVHWHWAQIALKYQRRVGRDLSLYESLILTLEEAAPYVEFYADASTFPGYESLVAFGYRSRVETLKDTLFNYLGLKPTEMIDFQIEFFAEAESRKIETLLRETPFDPRRAATLLASCVPNELNSLLESTSAGSQKSTNSEKQSFNGS